MNDNDNTKYNKIYEDELIRQSLQFPTNDKVPNCLTLFDMFLSCHS